MNEVITIICGCSLGLLTFIVLSLLINASSKAKEQRKKDKDKRGL